MDLRSEDFAARGEMESSSFRGFRWVEVCPDCGTQFAACLQDGVCPACNEFTALPDARWDR